MLEGVFIDGLGKDGFHNAMSGQMCKSKGRPQTVIAGVENIPTDLFNGFAMEAFQLSTDVVLDSYKILGRELQLSKAMPEWEEHLAFLHRVIGLALVDKRLQSLNEPMRFRYLEEHEIFA